MKSSSSNLAILIKYLNDTKNEYTKKIDFGLTEKKIIHELYSGKTANKEKLESIAQILRNNYLQLQTLLSPEYTSLKKILLAPNILQYNDAKNLPDHQENQAFSDFLEAHFLNELEHYLSKCFTEHSYSSILVLTQYISVLPKKIKDSIIKKMSDELERGIARTENPNSNSDNNLECLCNANFYRVLNDLGAAHFEDSLRALLKNSAIQILQQEQLYFHRIIYAMSFFNAVSGEFKADLDKAKAVSYKLGAREKQNAKKSQDEGKIYSQNLDSEEITALKELASGPSISTWKIIVGLITIVGGYFGMRDDNAKPTPPLSEQFDIPVKLITRNEISSINGLPFYVQCGDIEIIDSHQIEFDIKQTNFKQEKKHTSKTGLTFINHTEKPLIVLTHAERLFIKPKEQIATSSFTNYFSVYTGQNPQMIFYRDSTGHESPHFQFAEFNKSDSIILRRTHAFVTTSRDKKYTIDIRQVSDSIQVTLDTHGDDSIW